MYKIQWKSILNHDCVLTIDDESEEIINLIPGAKPFVTQEEDTDDIFEPVISQTGKISIVGSMEDLQGIMGETPLDRPVTLTVDDNVVWKGYLQSSAYSQDWNVGPNDIELPVVSPLAILESFYPPHSDASYLCLRTFAVFLVDMCEQAFDDNPYNYYIFPAISEPTVTLGYQFNMANYASWNKDKEAFEVSNYREILEDICKLFGWQVHEKGDKLIFLAPDTNSRYVQYTWQQLISIHNGEEVTPTQLHNIIFTEEIFGTEHTIDYLPGKRNVTVRGNVNTYDENIFSYNVNNLAFNEYKSYQKDGVYFSIACTFKGNDQISPSSYKHIRNENAAGANYNGGCLVYDNSYDGSAGWTPRIILAKSPSITSAIKIKSRFLITPATFSNVPYGFLRLKISGDVKVSDDETSDWTPSSNMTLTSRIKFGDNLYYYRNSWTNSPSSYDIPANNGKIDHMILLPTSGEEILEITLYSHELSRKYVSIENLVIKYNFINGALDSDSTNIYSENISQGFTEDLSVDTNLTTQSENIKGYTVQVGKGIILNHNSEVVTKICNKRPEVWLGDRMKDWYNVTRKKITATVKCNGKLLDPHNIHRLIDDTDLVCISQNIDWREDEIVGTFFEKDV